MPPRVERFLVILPTEENGFPCGTTTGLDKAGDVMIYLRKRSNYLGNLKVGGGAVTKSNIKSHSNIKFNAS